MARKRKRTPARRRPTARRRSAPRRRYRRNPTLLNRTIADSMAVVQLILGKFLARVVPQYIPGIRTSGAMGIGVQFGVALAIGMIASRFMGARVAENLVRGALMAPIEGMIVTAGIPVLSPALAGNGNGNGLSAYVQRRRLRPAARAGLSSYVSAAETDFSQQYA